MILFNPLPNILKAIALLVTITFVSPAFAATYTYDSLNHAVVITGDIEYNDFATKFLPLVKPHDDMKSIVITSNGGSFADGVQIGLFVNDNKISVDARDFCFSACAMIWLASPEKVLSTNIPQLDGALVGVHMPYNTDTGKTDTEALGLASWYFGKIGLTNKVIHDVINVNNPSIYILSPESTKDWGVGAVRVNDLRTTSVITIPHTDSHINIHDQ